MNYLPDYKIIPRNGFSAYFFRDAIQGGKEEKERSSHRSSIKRSPPLGTKGEAQNIKHLFSFQRNVILICTRNGKTCFLKLLIYNSKVGKLFSWTGTHLGQ